MTVRISAKLEEMKPAALTWLRCAHKNTCFARISPPKLSPERFVVVVVVETKRIDHMQRLFSPINEVPSPEGGGGGTRLSMSCGLGVCRWGSKTWPCRNALGAYQIHPVTIYLALKKNHMHTLSQYCTVAGAQIAACHKNCGLGSPQKQPCDKWNCPPVAN